MLIGGDFNVVVSPIEKQGGKPINMGSSIDFLDAIRDCCLTDAGFSGSSFTWSNNRDDPHCVMKRLDRVLLTENWILNAAPVQVHHLHRGVSDHAPLLLELLNSDKKNPSRFQFHSFWIQHPTFLTKVGEVWNTPIVASNAIRIFAEKLKLLRQELKIWNKNVYGNVFENIKKSEELMLHLEAQYERSRSETDRVQLHLARAHYTKNLLAEEIYWKEKARVKWLREGDKNTAFFHKTVKLRRNRNATLTLLNIEGEKVNENDVPRLIVEHFKNHLTVEPVSQAATLIELIPHMVTAELNASLTAWPEESEIRSAVFQLSKDSAPGPDGFSGAFFHSCWEIISADLIKAVHAFFAGQELPKIVTSTLICLVPKVTNPSSISELRPISLCNFFGKVFTKILATRISGILPMLISPQQSGFVKGRLISDNTILAQEIIQSLGLKQGGINIAMKLDMEKAFDRVSWFFLIKTLRAFGFDERFIDMVWRVLSNNHFSIIYKGQIYGYFQSSRGVRQGDPLSPALCILASEALSRGLNNLMFQDPKCSYKLPRGCSSISHLAFADDLVVFTKGTQTVLAKFFDLISHYERESGQRVNRQKSNFFVDGKVSAEQIPNISTWTGLKHATLPHVYLGIPLYTGRKLASLFDSIQLKVQAKLSSWALQYLSIGGRLILIRHVLSSLPIYQFMSLQPSKLVLEKLERMFSDFFWGTQEGKLKKHWISWRTICLPLCEGGLAIRRLQDMCLAATMKLWWQIRMDKSLLATFMSQKYFLNSSPCTVPLKQKSSHVWKRLIAIRNVMIENTFWMVGDGAHIYFWWDKWTAAGPLSRSISPGSDAKVEDFRMHHRWDVRGLDLPIAIRDDIYSVTNFLREDKCIWEPTKDGVFSFHATWNHIRHRAPSRKVFKRLWHQSVPLKVSILMWRIIHDAVPLDAKVQRTGVYMVSKCSCCKFLPQIETIHHLFSTGEIAQELWDDLEHCCSISPFSGPLNKRLEAWNCVSGTKLLQTIRQILPMCTCWALWVARCSAIYQGDPMDVAKVKFVALQQLRGALGKVVLQRDPTQQEQQVLQCLRIPVPKINKKEGPKLGCVPRTTDRYYRLQTGCYINPEVDLEGIGGVILDPNGDFVAGFTFNLKIAEDNRLKGIYAGLRMCKNRRIANVQVDINQSTAFLMDDSGSGCSWRSFFTFSRIRGLIREALNFEISFKQVNCKHTSLTRALAKWGYENGDHNFYMEFYLPSIVRAAYQQDKLKNYIRGGGG